MHISTMLVFWSLASLVRNSVVLTVYLLFSVACFFTVHEHWRMADSYSADADHLNFFLCTGKTEYIFSIRPQDTNIYCGASYNIVFDLGMFSGGQFFRIRNYKDNSENYCRFFCDFSYEFREIDIPTEECELGKCFTTSKGLMWCVKRYTDDEIVLQGCGEDEYIYRRTDIRTEQFAPVE